jgi:hypothetical protein
MTSHHALGSGNILEVESEKHKKIMMKFALFKFFFV